jgi:SAM-dependent methyltransferase
MRRVTARARAVHHRKTQPFTVADLHEATLKAPFRHALNRALSSTANSQLGSSGRAQLSILDLGCGRGLTVALLRRLGYDAHGAEIDKGQLELARIGCRDAGLPDSQFYRVLPDGTVDCVDHQFDLIISDNVVEHVPDITLFARETKRLLVPHGAACHLFPSRWHVREAHVKQPFVHWLPDSAARRGLVSFWTLLGVEAGWQNLPDVKRERAQAYARYLREKTFYRSPGAVYSAFRSQFRQVDAKLTAEIIAAKLPHGMSPSPVTGALGLLAVYFHTTVLWTE